MKKPTVINMFAGPSSGKSTTAAAVFSLLKIHGVNAELITEFAKDLTWENRHFTLGNQSYIMAKQYHRMWRVRNQVDVMVTDSPLLLSLVYNESQPQCIRESTLHHFNEFNNINYYLKRVKPYNPLGRNQTEEEARELDNQIRKVLFRCDIKYQMVSGSYKGSNTIARNILKYLGIPMRVYMKGFTEEKKDV